MGRMAWAVYLWPGLPYLWKRGAWSGLAVAVGFALALNLALVSSLVWTELEPLGAGNRIYVWLGVAIFWVGSAAIGAIGDHRRDKIREDADADDSFAEALDHYLQQNWHEAERCLVRLLRRDPRDVDARLMLATVLRRAGRIEESAGQLDRLGRMEGSRKWEHEIAQQRRWLAGAVGQFEQPQASANPSFDGERIAA
ncbi:MAG: tetratricopeptide repeat protein [Pirellulales bacterium]|nr:tetratricopeptide repeat protein [Pirellulales bacterium]